MNTRVRQKEATFREVNQNTAWLTIAADHSNISEKRLAVGLTDLSVV